MDEAAKRREARNRKILENSENRMKRITGVEQKLVNNTILSTPAPLTLSEETSMEPPAAKPFEVEETINHRLHYPQLNGGVANVEEKSRKLPLIQWSTYRLHIILSLAILVNFVNCVGFISESWHLNKVFIPLIVFRLIDFFMFDKNGHENKNIIYFLLLLNVQQSHGIRTFTQFLEVFTNLIQDVLVYFFVFACTDLVRRVLCVS